MKKIIATDNAPKAIGPYSQAVYFHGSLYISGQIPIDPATGKMVEGIKAQTEQVLKNINAILEEAKFHLSDVVKCTVMLQNMDDFAGMNEVYGRFFKEKQPARAAFQVAKLPLGALVEIEAIAIRQCE